MIFELTNDYRIILPLMIACIISVLITSRLKKDSIYTLKLSRRGIELFQGQEVNVLRSLPVSDVMTTDYETIPAGATFRQLLDLTVHSSHGSFFVVDHDKHVLGVISVHDVRKLIYQLEGLEPIVVAHDLMNPVRHCCTVTERLDTVMVAFAQLKTDVLPVVGDMGERRLIGVVSQSDVIDAYNLAVFKRDTITSISSHIKSVSDLKRIRIANGQDLSEIEIPRAFVNDTLEHLALRRRYGVEVILIKQHYNAETKEWGNVMAPSPDYRFEIGDRVLLMGPQEGIDRLSRMA